jgi:copper chaperone CopZ
LFLIREEGTISHNLRTVVITPSGRIQHVFRDNRWEASELTAQMLAAAAEPTTATPQTCQLSISGMACDACALTIQSGLRKLPGVISASVDYTNQIGTVSFLPHQTNPQDLIRTIRELNYDATVGTPIPADSPQSNTSH